MDSAVTPQLRAVNNDDSIGDFSDRMTGFAGSFEQNCDRKTIGPALGGVDRVMLSIFRFTKGGAPPLCALGALCGKSIPSRNAGITSGTCFSKTSDVESGRIRLVRLCDGES